MISSRSFLRDAHDYFERRGLSVILDDSSDGFVVRRKVNGVVHRMFIEAALMMESGAPRELVNQSIEKKIADFIWSTERPRLMVAGYCGTPRFLGRRCAI